jgi:hypothetical protein
MNGAGQRLKTLARAILVPDRECLAELENGPVPLASDVLDVALLWNAKAGCTFAVKWLFWQEGVLDEALSYSGWPHDYREQVFCRRPAHAAAIRRIPALGERAIKFVRNPFDRAVGSYLFFAMWGQRRHDRQHVDVLNAIAMHLGYDLDAREPFSFREFVGFLGSLDLKVADVHLRQQLSTCEQNNRLPGLTVVRVEESSATLPGLEERLGLRHADLQRLRHSRHDTTRVVSDGFVGDERYTRTLKVPMPRSPSFYDDQLEAAVARLYRGDIEAYRYELSGPIEAAA